MPYGNQDGPSMESAKQERKDLLRDNPVVRDMDSSRPWISKHFQSSMSPLKDAHEDGNSPAMEKMKMVKGPDGNMIPAFAADGKGPNDERKGVSKLYDAAGHMHTPLHEYDRVVLGGNKGDKSKTNPGKKDYEK